MAFLEEENLVLKQQLKDSHELVARLREENQELRQHVSPSTQYTKNTSSEVAG